MKTLLEFINESEKQKVNGFCILKPGFTNLSDQFITLLKANNWSIIDQCTCKLTRDEAEQLYINKKDEPYYQNLCDYMICDDCLCCACYKDCEDPIKDMNELKKHVRADWGEDDMKNAMHSSDSLNNVDREYKICIGECVEK